MRAIRASTFGKSVVVLSLAGAMLLPAETASAATPPGKVDPNSPAGKEYAVPLDTARHNAGGGGGSSSGASGSSASRGGSAAASSAGSGGSAPAFGVGVSPRATTPRSATGAKGGQPSVNRKGAARLGGSAAEARGLKGSSAAVAQQNAGTVAPASSTVGLTAGIIAAVLVAGIAGGLVVRRFGRGASR